MKYHKPQFTSTYGAVPAIRGLNRKVLVLLMDSLGIGYRGCLRSRRIEEIAQ
jgi:hypothetical protein